MKYQDNSDGLVSLSADIVSAYVSKNSVPASALPALIGSVYRSLVALRTEQAAAPVGPQKPAVSVRKSVQNDYIVCLEDGKKFKSLKRHLSVHFGLSPAEYREKWNLPRDYPMVAPSYAAERSALALKLGLGRKAKEVKPAPAPVKRGRKKASTA